MKLVVEKTEKLEGTATVPPSKSHSHRAIILASLASGTSIIDNYLQSKDCLSTINACEAIGATIKREHTKLIINGVHGKPQLPKNTINVDNSGTTLRLLCAVVAHCNGKVTLTGDTSIQQRPIEPLLQALNDLGAKAFSIKGNGRPPVSIEGIIKGGETTIQGISSQFLSALLITCPLAKNDSKIHVVGLKSTPYVNMTLEHLNNCGVKIHHDNYSSFTIKKNQIIKPINYVVPADYSSASFLFAAASITKSNIKINGLDSNDVQGDKIIHEIIKKMEKGSKRFIDLGDTPDLLPISSVLACYAQGSTTLFNVEHARLKESDRIMAMSNELKKMGADIQENSDGLTIHHSQLMGTQVNGYDDHRIVMALAIAGLGANGKTEITNAESISISYPNFIETMKKLKANIAIEESCS